MYHVDIKDVDRDKTNILFVNNILCVNEVQYVQEVVTHSKILNRTILSNLVHVT